MKTSYKNVFVLWLLLVLLLTNCVPLVAPAGAVDQSGSVQKPDPSPVPTEISQVVAVEPEDASYVPSSEEEAAAVEVATTFYAAYLSSMRSTGPKFGSAEFSAADFLSSDYLKQMAEMQAGFEGFGFDPVMQTQIDPPDPMEVKQASISGDEAAVVLQFGRGVIDPPWKRTVSLERFDGQWKIVPDRLAGPALTPEETVQAFYDWYLDMAAKGGPGNVLTNRAYHDSPYLTPMLKADVDHLFDEQGIMFDPFLCAQDIPSNMDVIASFDNAMRPVVVVDSSFAGHTIVLDMVRSNFNYWAITKITCGRSFTGAAKGFYTSILGYMTAGTEPRNPWVDGFYRDSLYLSKGMISELDARMASGEPLEADPVLLAQDIPQAIGVMPCPGDQPCAYVNLQYGDSTIRKLRVDFQVEEGRSRIVNISRVVELESPKPEEGPYLEEGWVPYRDEQYGYALRYPQQWILEGLHVNDLHTEEEMPLIRSVSLRSPDLPANISALRIELEKGVEADITGLYDLQTPVKEFEVNGFPGGIFRTGSGNLVAVVQHPYRPGYWLILQDMVSGFPGREDYAGVTAGVLETMVTTIAFAE